MKDAFEAAPKMLTKKELQTENYNLKDKIRNLKQQIETLKIQPKISDESLVTENESLKFKVEELKRNKLVQDNAYQVLQIKHAELSERLKI